jgi:hypothetical protein
MISINGRVMQTKAYCGQFERIDSILNKASGENQSQEIRM